MISFYSPDITQLFVSTVDFTIINYLIFTKLKYIFLSFHRYLRNPQLDENHQCICKEFQASKCTVIFHTQNQLNNYSIQKPQFVAFGSPVRGRCGFSNKYHSCLTVSDLIRCNAMSLSSARNNTSKHCTSNTNTNGGVQRLNSTIRRR